MSPERVSVGEEGGKGISFRWSENRKGVGTNSGESGAREIWRLRVSETEQKSMVGCVKFKTVTEIRRNSARDTFTAQSVYRGWKRSMMMIPGFAVTIEN